MKNGRRGIFNLSSFFTVLLICTVLYGIIEYKTKKEVKLLDYIKKTVYLDKELLEEIEKLMKIDDRSFSKFLNILVKRGLEKNK